MLDRPRCVRENEAWADGEEIPDPAADVRSFSSGLFFDAFAISALYARLKPQPVQETLTRDTTKLLPSASSAPSWPTSTTSGRQPTGATSPKTP